MDILTIDTKIKKSFPKIQPWSPKNNRWKGRSILIGYKVKINDIEC